MRERVTRRGLRHDRHTVSLLTGHKVFSQNMKVVEGEVAEAPRKLSGKPAKNWIEVIDKPFFRKESFVKET